MLEDLLQTMRSAFSYFIFQDLIDILVMTFVLYQLLKISQQTRAMQVLKGLGIILVASWISGWLGLISVNWLLKYLVDAGALVIVILFQPELRKSFEQIGRSKLIKTPRAVLDQEDRDLSWVIGEIQRAAQDMSRKRIGALIVFERRSNLDEVARTGTTVDGRVSSALLQNIFEPNTPLHDGAVIIRQDRVVSAGCFLPLSENTSISKELGTRHRAALGISETSDALTVIVSEETGVLSMASEGVLTRYLDSAALEAMLSEMYQKNSHSGFTIGSFIRRRGK